MPDLSDIPFYKFSATGNDFILIDNRHNVIPKGSVRLFRQLCERRVSVGADGVLLVEKSAEHDFRMRYFNADGYESEMCGNGARSVAYYASMSKITGPRMSFAVGDDHFEAEVLANDVKLTMPWPKGIELNLGIVEEEYLIEAGYLNCGVPHFVVFSKSVAELNVETLGRKYRCHPRFRPRGTNVDFVEFEAYHRIRVRTFERGVERETLSCGTGAVASAYMSSLHEKTTLPTEVVTSGGTLQVAANEGANRIYLSGPVKLVYEGTLVA
ncbi:diaminopimelate epimerase [bacterium]|nr:diaminopimelate epimerase [bacterium]